MQQYNRLLAAKYVNLVTYPGIQCSVEGFEIRRGCVRQGIFVWLIDNVERSSVQTRRRDQWRSSYVQTNSNCTKFRYYINGQLRGGELR